MADAYTIEQVKEKITSAFSSEEVKILDKTRPRQIYMEADKDAILKLCTFLKDELNFEHCSCVSGVDRIDRFQVVYHITSYANSIMVEIVVDLPHDNPEIDTISLLWGGANWHEREAYDMYGIIFKNHPKLERILLDESVQFFPMRKDFKSGGL
ncbi:NADH-quinone oxidoreductase subunit C [Candidatus Methanomassiliicoccus intestinalis]|uniref:NADH-quinone oxidoreductase subunit C n=1 Tax=Candidatus Methanomassiliicoccus intestinalis TaxID=1406512 RepID=UPI0037DD6611